MEVEYASTDLERACLDDRQARRALGEVAGKALGKRFKQIEASSSVQDLLDGVGKWHWLNGDRSGQLAGHLTANQRIVVEPMSGNQKDATATRVRIVEIVDYH